MVINDIQQNRQNLELVIGSKRRSNEIVKQQITKTTVETQNNSIYKQNRSSKHGLSILIERTTKSILI